MLQLCKFTSQTLSVAARVLFLMEKVGIFFWLTQQRGKHKSFFGHWKMHGLVGGVDVIHYSLLNCAIWKFARTPGEKRKSPQRKRKFETKKGSNSHIRCVNKKRHLIEIYAPKSSSWSLFLCVDDGLKHWTFECVIFERSQLELVQVRNTRWIWTAWISPQVKWKSTLFQSAFHQNRKLIHSKLQHFGATGIAAA